MLHLLFFLVIFLMGLIFGSFLNSVIYRLGVKESFSSSALKKKDKKIQEIRAKRSYCPKCKHKLSWIDLIPVLSFAALKGKCRYCKKSISWQYPLVEIFTALVFLIIASLDLGVLTTVFYLILSLLLIIIFVFDFLHYLIPDEATFFLIALVFLYNILMFLTKRWGVSVFLNHIFSALGSFGFLGSIFFVSKGRWMGFGDVKFSFFMGLLLGFPNILTGFFISFFLGAIIGCILIAFGKKGLKSEIPFGPFLVLGTFISLFWGNLIIERYLSLFY